MSVLIESKTDTLVGSGLVIGTYVTPPANGAIFSGNVGIGTTSPHDVLQVSAAANDAILIGGHINQASGGCISSENNAALLLKPLELRGSAILLTGGIVTMSNYGVGTATFDASGNISSVSDESVKKDIRSFNRGLEAVEKLRPILYGYTLASGLDQTKGDYAGFSAQNVKEHIPEAVGQNRDGNLSLDLRPILATLVNAVKELNQKVEALQAV